MKVLNIFQAMLSCEEGIWTVEHVPLSQPTTVGDNDHCLRVSGQHLRTVVRRLMDSRAGSSISSIYSIFLFFRNSESSSVEASALSAAD